MTIELERAKRRDVPTGRKRRSKADYSIDAAFARASREQEELRRLKASGKPLCQLDFVGAFGYVDGGGERLND